MTNKVGRYVVVVGLTSILAISGGTQAGIFKGSLVDKLFVSGPKEKKAQKKLENYASDGYISSSEKSSILGTYDSKKIRRKIEKINTQYKIKEKARRKALAKQEYKAARDAYKHNDYHSALYHINEAVKYNPGKLRYKMYRDQIKAEKRTKKQFKKGCRWVAGKLDGLKYKLEKGRRRRGRRGRRRRR